MIFFEAAGCGVLGGEENQTRRPSCYKDPGRSTWISLGRGMDEMSCKLGMGGVEEEVIGGWEQGGTRSVVLCVGGRLRVVGEIP